MRDSLRLAVLSGLAGGLVVFVADVLIDKWKKNR
jgi:hypothetical protein